MENILIMGVSEAHHKSKSSVLADEIWCYKNPNQTVDYQDGEYKSWLHSIPCFLDVVIEAGLGDLEVIFELPTPLGGYIDIALIGSSLKAACVESGRVLILAHFLFSVFISPQTRFVNLDHSLL